MIGCNRPVISTDINSYSIDNNCQNMDEAFNKSGVCWAAHQIVKRPIQRSIHPETPLKVRWAGTLLGWLAISAGPLLLIILD
jgi:hypothetical protein